MSGKKFDLENYVSVSDRLAEFRGKFPEGCISTDRVPEEEGVSFKTSVYRTKEEAVTLGTVGTAAATGHSFLLFSDAGPKAEEKAETTSVGRALANLGLSVENGIASREEMEDFAEEEYEARRDDRDYDEEPEDEPKLKTNRKFGGGKKKPSRFSR